MSQQGSYPPQQQGYYPPPQQQGYYPPQQGYYPPPQQGGYPQPQQPPLQQGYYSPQQGYYPSAQQDVYSPQQGHYPPPQGYSPQQGYPPQQGGYPHQPPQDGYPPQQQGYYPPPQQGYYPPQQGYYPPPQQGGHPQPQQGGYPQPQQGGIGEQKGRSGEAPAKQQQQEGINDIGIISFDNNGEPWRERSGGVNRMWVPIDLDPTLPYQFATISGQGAFFWDADLMAPYQSITDKQLPPGCARALDVLPEQDLLVVAGGGEAWIDIWNISSKTKKKTMLKPAGLKDYFPEVCLLTHAAPQAIVMTYYYYDKDLSIFDIETTKRVVKIERPDGKGGEARLLKDPTQPACFVCAPTADEARGTMMMYDARDPSKGAVRNFLGLDDDICSLQIARTKVGAALTLMAACYTGTIKLYDISTAKLYAGFKVGDKIDGAGINSQALAAIKVGGKLWTYDLTKVSAAGPKADVLTPEAEISDGGGWLSRNSPTPRRWCCLCGPKKFYIPYSDAIGSASWS